MQGRPGLVVPAGRRRYRARLGRLAAGDDRRRRHHAVHRRRRRLARPNRPGSTCRCRWAAAAGCPRFRPPAVAARGVAEQDPDAGSPPMSPPSPTRSPASRSCSTRQQLVGGGTSQSAPIWAGLAAVMNQYLLENGGRRLGDLNPAAVQGRRGRAAARLSRRHPRRQRGRRRGARLRPGDRPRHARRRQPRPQHPRSADGDGMSTAQTERRPGHHGVPGLPDRRSRRRVLRALRRPSDGAARKRPGLVAIRAYGAAPGEHLLRPSLASSLFPQLPHRSRRPFQLALVVVLLALVTFATLRMPAALIPWRRSASAVLPVVHAGDRRLPRYPARTLLLTAALGIGLGVGWVC